MRGRRPSATRSPTFARIIVLACFLASFGAPYAAVSVYERLVEGDWAASGLTRYEIDEFKRVGVSSPEEALRWRAAGFKPPHASLWRDEGFGPEAAAGFYGGSIHPGEARIWRREGFEPVEAARWKLAGFYYPEALEMKEAGKTPEEASRIREERHKR